MTICNAPGCQEHYGCQLRNKGLMLSASAIPSRVFMRPPKMAEPSWEKGIVWEDRPGGYKVPLLSADLSRPIGIKEYAENRKTIDAQRRKQIEIGA